MPSRDDFLRELDAKLQGLKQAEAQQVTQPQQVRTWIERAAEHVCPKLEEWKRLLEARGIKTEVMCSPSYFTFRMIYRDEGYYGFELRQGEHGQYFIEDVFTDEHGREAHTLGHRAITETWNPESIEQTIRSVVDAFLVDAPRHGGIHTPD